MSVLVSLYHAVFTFHTMLLPASVHYLGQLGKIGKLILLPRHLGGGVMTLHDYGYLPPEFLKSYPVSE